MRDESQIKFVPLYKAIADLKSDLGPIIKDKTNPFYKSKYTDINGLLDVIEPLAKKHGLLIIQPLVCDAQMQAVRTMIVHIETGLSITSTKRISDSITDPQKEGGAITYYRRYGLKCLLSLRAEDDDGNTASGKTKKVATKSKSKVVESNDDF